MGVAKPLLSHTAVTPVADRSLEGHDRQALSESDHRRHDARTDKLQRPAQHTIRHLGSLLAHAFLCRPLGCRRSSNVR